MTLVLTILLVVSNLFWALVMVGAGRRTLTVEAQLRDAQALNARILEAAQRELGMANRAIVQIMAAMPRQRGC